MKTKRVIITLGLLPWLTTKYLMELRTKKIWRVYRRLKNQRLSLEPETDRKVIKEQRAVLYRMNRIFGDPK